MVSVGGEDGPGLLQLAALMNRRALEVRLSTIHQIPNEKK